IIVEAGADDGAEIIAAHETVMIRIAKPAGGKYRRMPINLEDRRIGQGHRYVIGARGHLARSGPDADHARPADVEGGEGLSCGIGVVRKRAAERVGRPLLVDGGYQAGGDGVPGADQIRPRGGKIQSERAGLIGVWGWTLVSI